MKYKHQFDGKTYTNLSMQTTMYDAQTYQYKLRYNWGTVEEYLLHKKYI